MRCLAIAAVLVVAQRAHADDALGIGAAVGAGGQGGAGYGALELRLDAEWRTIRIGLGGRAVWEGDALRTHEWARPADALRVLRQLEAHAGPVSLAAGALAPATIARVASEYRASLDDLARTGARAALRTERVELGLEIDDVLDPALAGGALAWQLAPPWGVHVAAAVDPSDGRAAVEAGGAHRWRREGQRIEAGASVVVEDTGLGAVGFASAAMDRGGARWTIGADLRAGNGTNGAAFGPLYRVEREGALDGARAGLGGGVQLGVASDTGWITLGGRARPGLGALGVLSAGAPMGRAVQAGGWIAASRRATAGAAELRVAWAKRFYSSLQLARMYTRDDAMQPATEPVWSATAWFGAALR